MVGQKHQLLARPGVVEANAAQMFRVFLRDRNSVEQDALIADDAAGSVCRMRIDAPCRQVLPGAGDEEGPGLMDRVQSSEVQVCLLYTSRCV